MAEDLEKNVKGFSGLFSLVSDIENIDIKEDLVEIVNEPQISINDADNISTQTQDSGKNTKRAIWLASFLIISLAACFYWYNYIVIHNEPEEIVNKFYHAYFERDFNTVAKNLSVFWSVRFLPDYSSMSPEQLLENRTKIEGDISKVIADIEIENSVPKDVSIEVMKEYTKMGKNSAIVVYTFKENGKDTGMETALLIKEKEQLRIFNMSPVNPETLEQIKSVDIKVLDEKFDSLLKTGESK